MKRIDKACRNIERTSELLKLPGIQSYPGGLKITIMNNFCPVHYHMQVKGCVTGSLGTKDCIKCWNIEMEEEMKMIKMYNRQPKYSLGMTDGYCGRIRMVIVDEFGFEVPNGKILEVTEEGISRFKNIDPVAAGMVGFALDENGAIQLDPMFEVTKEQGEENK